MDSMISRLEKYAGEGMFGEINLLRVGPSPNKEKSAQFQSQQDFFEVDLVTRKGKVRKVPVLVKTQPEAVQPYMHDQFANEVFFYEKVVPRLGAKEFCPIIYHGYATRGKHPEQDILILEDLRLQGYKVPEKCFLDFDHINLAIRRLGEFHGLSYKMKISSPNEFNALKDGLTEKWVWDCEPSMQEAIRRGFEKDLQSTPGYSLLNKAYNKLASSSAMKLTRNLLAPEEPFAVIVHGDYLKNHVLYKYDENNKPCDVKMSDFATAMYSDPAIDLSLFLYMHTSDGREEHWNDYLQSYWDGILSVGQPGFTFREFMNNFAKRAVYGYIVCSHFLPLTLHPEGIAECFSDFDSAFDEMPDDRKRELARTYGGEGTTAALRSIVRHLQDEGYLEEYLLNFKQ